MSAENSRNDDVLFADLSMARRSENIQEAATRIDAIVERFGDRALSAAIDMVEDGDPTPFEEAVRDRLEKRQNKRS